MFSAGKKQGRIPVKSEPVSCPGGGRDGEACAMIDRVGAVLVRASAVAGAHGDGVLIDGEVGGDG